ncbi:glycosyl transferase [Nitrospira sp.]|nr:glycosyl transferase [Nitrospira sp.]
MDDGEVDLTVLVITKNEAHNIEACLRSVAWARTRIVIDSQSTDETVPLAERAGARVWVRPWAGYGPQKNFGLDQAQTEWVLILDADERVPIDLAREIRDRLSKPLPSDVAGLEVPRRNFFYGRWIQYGGMYPDYQLRLVRRRVCRYDDTRLHERMTYEGRVLRVSHAMDHLTMPTVGHHARKVAAYSTLGAEEKLKRQRMITRSQIAWHHLGTITKTYVLRGAIREGIHGLIVSLFAGMFTFLKYAKAWEAQVHADAMPKARRGRHATRH